MLFALETQGLCPLPILRPSRLSSVLTISEKEQQILRMVLEPPAPSKKPQSFLLQPGRPS